MHFHEQALSVVLNGEIYNFRQLRANLQASGYRFQSSSDTEVLLAAYDAWGVGCLDHLNGMFAFAIYDARRQQVFLARDRAGEKPLFYYHDQSQLRFASELKALLVDQSLPRKVDSASLESLLSLGFVPGSRCILSGYRKLPPAHAMCFNIHDGSLRVWRYWSLPQAPREAKDENDLLDELEHHLEEAVRRQMVADVPVGILLSGGVDSSLVTAMAVRQSPRIRTFSVSFPGHDNLDEAPHARLISNAFQTEHLSLQAEPASADIVLRLARQYDEPIVDSSMIPTYLVSQTVKQHCTVALGGDGGDELFGGYGHHSRLLSSAAIAAKVPRAVRSLLAHLASAALPTGFKGRNWLQTLAADFDTSLPILATVFDSRERASLFGGRLGEHEPAAWLDVFPPSNGDLIQSATRTDFSNYLPEDILVKVDRASMLASLELRSPFLDRHVIEFAFGSVPSSLKTTVNDRKILLKRLCSRLLPEEFDLRRKQGFSIPMRAWLQGGPLRDLFWSVLTDRNSSLDRRSVVHLLAGQDAGMNNGERLFALVMFELWRQHYRVTV
jgi:asparagine synthase (glutamine-hydrolysing)